MKYDIIMITTNDERQFYSMDADCTAGSDIVAIVIRISTLIPDLILLNFIKEAQNEPEIKRAILDWCKNNKPRLEALKAFW